MNRTFDVPLDMITADSELEDLGIDDSSFDVILMNIESRMNVTLPVDEDYEFRNVGDVITMIKSSNN
jgi:acyl carrier protein